MRDGVLFRGWACRGAATVDGIVERVKPGAFSLSAEIHVLFGSHDGNRIASNRDGSLEIFQNRHGLAFQMSVEGVSDAIHLSSAVARGGMTKCSVNFIDFQFEEYEGRRRIVHAEIDHIAVLPNAAYDDTAVWLADVDSEYDLPPDVRAAAREWETAYLLNDIAQRKQQRERTEMRVDGSGNRSAVRDRRSFAPSDRKPHVPDSVYRLFEEYPESFPTYWAK